VTSARHKYVLRPATRRRLARLALPAAAATLATGAVVGVAVATGPADKPVAAAAPAARATPMTVDLDAVDSTYLADRAGAVSRSAKRVTLQKKPTVKDHEYMTSALNLWSAPKEQGKPLDVLDVGKTVAVTGVVQAGFAQILYDGQVRWVNNDYLSDQKPQPPEPARTGTGASTATTSTATTSPGPAGVSFAPCPDGSGTEAGLTSSAVRLFRAVCNAFPALSTYGGYDNHGEHSSGQAIDFMVSDPSLGQSVADWARAHASELDLYDVLWSQHIWTPVRSSEGWRSMPDRGSATANHYDHVHISVN
jgi:hypothetical protein